METSPGPALVVVSYYDQRPQQQLEDLLTSLATVPAGGPFEVLVVVNQTGAPPLDLGGRHPGVRVLHRPNTGYNIGAWEHGWRAAPDHWAYLFLQQECVVRRANWLAAFTTRLAEPGLGLLGERQNPAWDRPWTELEAKFAGHTLPDHQVDGQPAERLATYRHFWARHGIDPGRRGDHLQTLVLAARREVLLRIGGLPCGRDYGEAIAAEIGISKRVQALGLAVDEVGPAPFTWIGHPQWLAKVPDRAPPAPRTSLGQWLAAGAPQRYAGKPWLVLGKGPTYGELRPEHARDFHLFALNHVVREQRVALAHAIDIDVVAACADRLAAHCEFLLMPRVPHVGGQPGPRRLEDYFAELPVLWSLEKQGRLVWYNCSTAAPLPGSPVVEVQYFSSEAALGLLAQLGAKQVRSLGIDGGRQYSGRFADLAGTTRLQNGQPLFDLQFARLAAIVAQHGLDYAPLQAPLQLALLGGPELDLPAAVLEATLRQHTSYPLAFVRAATAAAAPAAAVQLPAAALAHGDAAALRGQRGAAAPRWLEPFDQDAPWRRAAGSRGERWLDAFAAAVNAGVVTAALVRRAVRRGHVGRHLLHLPPPPAPPAADPAAAAEARARTLARELANLRLSRTFQLGRTLLSPVLAVQRRWQRRRGAGRA